MDRIVSDMLLKLEAVYKAAGTEFMISGNFTNQQTEAWFNVIRNKSWFLKLVFMRLVDKISGNVGFIEPSPTGLIRGVEGTDMTQTDGHTQRYAQYNLVDLDLAEFIGYSVIDSQPDAQIVDKINAALDQTAANSLQNLFINGVANSYAGSSFMNLAIGWVQLAQNIITADPTQMPRETLAQDDPRLDNLDQLALDMLTDMPQERRATAKFICSDNNRLKRIRAITTLPDGNAQAIALAAMSDQIKNYIGQVATICPDFWPDDFFMLVDPANLELDIHRTIRRAIEERPNKKGFNYNYSIKAGCQIISTKDTVVAY